LRAFAWQPWIRVLGTAALGGWFIVVIGPTLVAVEALRAGNDVSLNAGATDVAFFRSGWSEVVGAANVRSRVVRDAATLRLPLPGVAEYRATVRMDPFPRPAGPGTGKLPTIQFTLNGTPIATTPLTWSADRVGAYDITLPQSAVRAGVNDLEVRVMRPGADQTRTPSEQPGLTEGDAAAVWYFRLHPMPR
jgi:hypothetical protein